MHTPLLFADIAPGRRLERVGVIATFLLSLVPACGKSSIEAEPAADAAPKPDAGALSCPQGLPGAKFVLIHGASGGAYCIDQREVTKGEYTSTAVNAKGDAALDVTSEAGSACHGVGAGYADVYDLSGDVAEWSNSCVDQGGVSCINAGGAWKANQADLECGGGGVTAVKQTLANLGFRCCADPIPAT